MDYYPEFEVADPEDIILPDPEPTEMPTPALSKNYQGLLFLWIMFCVFSFSWFVKKLFRGRSKMRTDFVTIEEQLKRLQMCLESKENIVDQEKFDEAISSLTNMTALDSVLEQDGTQDGEQNGEVNRNVEENKNGEVNTKLIQDGIVEEQGENNLEEKKNL